LASLRNCEKLATLTTAASLLQAPDLAGSPAVRWSRLGRWAAAATLVLAASCQLVAFLTEVQHSKTIERLEWIADHPVRANVAKTFDLLAMPFLFGVVVVYVLLSRERSRRLAYAGGIVLACGMVGLTAAQGFEVLEFALVEDGRFDLTALADAVDNVSIAPAIAMLLLFIPGVFFGLLTMAVALWRSQAVPRGAVVLIPLFILTDIFLQQGVLGHAIALVGAVWIASAVLLAGRFANAA
jgi:hypothetical protein